MKIRPKGRMVLVRRIEPGQRKSAGGIILPDGAKNPVDKAEVLAVGPGLLNEETGKRIAPDVVVGEIVLVPRYAGTEVSIGGEKLYLVPAPEIMADIEEEESEQIGIGCASSIGGIA